MPSKNTWQARGEYLANCIGLTAQQFAASIDSAMTELRQGAAAAKPAATQRSSTARKGAKRAGSTKVTAGAGATN